MHLDKSSKKRDHIQIIYLYLQSMGIWLTILFIYLIILVFRKNNNTGYFDQPNP